MQDKELYQTILCLSTPWQVEDVELDVNQGEIRVSVEHGLLAIRHWNWHPRAKAIELKMHVSSFIKRLLKKATQFPRSLHG